MSATDRQGHWENVYTTKGEKEVSWFQETPAPTLELMALIGATRRSAVIDIGGGASRLVDSLVSRDYEDITVLDLSSSALAAAKARLAGKADRIQWIAADVTTWEPSRAYDVWHDRAAFHFLTDPADQAAYLDRLRRALRRGGHAIIGTFALDGPQMCSGLPVARFDASTLGALLGSDFILIDARPYEHETPRGAKQRFQFSTFRFRRVAEGGA
ncbi:MAG: methyltransferase domain-containing protein [Roseiarcus sp.]